MQIKIAFVNVLTKGLKGFFIKGSGICKKSFEKPANLLQFIFVFINVIKYSPQK